MAAELVSSLEK